FWAAYASWAGKKSVASLLTSADGPTAPYIVASTATAGMVVLEAVGMVVLEAVTLPVSQPMAFMTIRSAALIFSIWPGGLNARNASAPALACKSPKSPLGLVLKLFKFVLPLSIEK